MNDHGTNPNEADTDEDGEPDAYELANGTDPTDPTDFVGVDPTTDYDQDQLPDGWEIQHFGNITAYDGTSDPDQDHAINSEEYLYLLDPNDPDSDSDLVLDGYELLLSVWSSASASLVTLDSPGGVAQWNDLSMAANHFAEADIALQPVWIGDSTNGHGAVSITGGQNLIAAQSSFLTYDPNVTPDTEFTVLLAFKPVGDPAAAGSEQVLFSIDNAFRVSVVAGKLMVRWNDGTWEQAGTLLVSGDTPHILSLVFAGNGSDLILRYGYDQEVSELSAPTLSGEPGAFRLGTAEGLDALPMEVLEVMLFEAAIEDDQRIALRDYLAAAYDISLVNPRPADADGDGMTDTWETDNGLNPNDPDDRDLDPDRDGLTNLEEFLAGSLGPDRRFRQRWATGRLGRKPRIRSRQSFRGQYRHGQRWHP